MPSGRNLGTFRSLVTFSEGPTCRVILTICSPGLSGPTNTCIWLSNKIVTKYRSKFHSHKLCGLANLGCIVETIQDQIFNFYCTPYSLLCTTKKAPNNTALHFTALHCTITCTKHSTIVWGLIFEGFRVL